MRRYLQSSAVNDPVSAWGLYKSDDDQTHSDDLCCRGGWRGGNLARVGAALSGHLPARPIRRNLRPIRPAAIRPIIAVRPATPDFDALEDDGRTPSSTALPPPGPVLSPDDPRYGRPMGAPPVYSDRGAPTGPVLSPDDPRYGRPAGPPPVIYSDRPGGPPQQTYSDRDNRAPGSGFIYPGEDNRGMRPPGAVGAPMAPPDRCSLRLGPDGRPMVLSALPAG